MNSADRQLGAIPTPALVIVLAVLIIGGTVFFLTTGSDIGNINAPDKKHGFTGRVVEIEGPESNAVEREIPRLTDESDNILQGDLIKYYDEYGNVRFRSRELKTGFDAEGNTIYFSPDLLVGPSLKRQKISFKSSQKKKLEPPKFTSKDGRLKLIKHN